MEQFLNGASSKVFDVALKSGMSFATSFAMKRINKIIDDQLNQTITTVVGSATTQTLKLRDLEKLKGIRDRIEIKMNILTRTLDHIANLGASKGSLGIETCRDCNKLLAPIVENLEGWIHEDNSSIENSMKLLEQDINTVSGYLNLSLAVLNSTKDVQYDSTFTESTGFNLTNEFLLKSGLIIGDKTNINTFECSYYELTSFHENKAVWKELCRRSEITFESCSDYLTKIKLKQNFDDEIYHDLEEETEFETEFNIKNLEKIFFNNDASTIGFGEPGLSCIVLKCSNDKWISFLTYKSYEHSESESDSGDEKSENDDDFKSVLENRVIRHFSMDLLVTIIKLFKIQELEEKLLLDLSDDILNFYTKEKNFISFERKIDDENVDKVTRGIHEINI